MKRQFTTGTCRMVFSEGATPDSRMFRFDNQESRQGWLFRAFPVLAITSFLFATAMVWPAAVEAPAVTGPEKVADWELPAALERFGGEQKRNFCPILFGGVSVRSDLVVILRIRHAEQDLPRDLNVRATLEEFNTGRLYAWVDIRRWALYLTDNYQGLTHEEKLALLFHEVRGHWELRLTDRQMLSVLYPGIQNFSNTHLITLAILRGCPSLEGKNTESVYQIAVDNGPFIPDQ